MRYALVLVSVLLAPALAGAQEPTTAYYLDAGASFPIGDTYDAWEPGFNVGGGIELPWTRTLRLRTELNYNRFPLDGDAFTGAVDIPVEVDGGDFSSFTAMGLLQYLLPASGRTIQPYLLGGLGYWRESIEDFTLRFAGNVERLEGGTDNGVAGAVGAGASIPVGQFTAIFLEGRYVLGWDFGDPPDLDTSYLPVKIGISIVP